MKQGFEDNFMEMQSEFISLCLEVASPQTEIIYVFIYNGNSEQMFNAFFKINNEIISIIELTNDEKNSFEFLKIGTNDIEQINALCDEYQHQAPTLFKMVYEIKSGRFDATYAYEELCSSDSKIIPEDLFRQWKDEIKSKL